MLLEKTKLNTIKVLIYKALVDSYINYDEFFSIYLLKQSASIKPYCVSCKKNTAINNSSVRRTKQNRLILVSNCSIWAKKKSRFIKNQEVSRLELH